VQVGQGAGTKLRDIPNVAYKLGKLTGKDELVEGLHMVLFRRKGEVGARLRGCAAGKRRRRWCWWQVARVEVATPARQPFCR
jgi:hypothetical protein